jgi:hypothetical protein
MFSRCFAWVKRRQRVFILVVGFMSSGMRDIGTRRGVAVNLADFFRVLVNTRIPFGVLFVLIRVVSWIVYLTPAKRTIHEITRTNTKRSNP